VLALQRAIAALAAALAVSACCQSAERKDRAPAAFQLALLDDGREPRRQLRYPSDPPPPQKMSLSLNVAMKMNVPGSPIPPVTMPGLRLLVDLTGRDRDDGVRYEFTVTDADLTGAEAAHPSLVAAMRKGVTSLVGTSGSLSVDPRGFQRELSIGLPSGLGQELTQFMNSAKLAIGQMAIPLPEEAIGVGAKWQVEETIAQDGIQVRQKTYYELLAIEGPRLQIRTQTVQSAEQQKAALPGLPSGVTAKVVSLRGAGAGESEIDLRRLVPGSAREELETDVSFAIVQGQNERVMSLTATTGLEIQSL
ncbi:MAG TPA: hypothetical protein VFU21_05660, partial [Kofleriaceae bacterium]|nr:hypothetical protein [Kofleriaceae bacterium]